MPERLARAFAIAFASVIAMRRAIDLTRHKLLDCYYPCSFQTFGTEHPAFDGEVSLSPNGDLNGIRLARADGGAFDLSSINLADALRNSGSGLSR
jgi:hypothetical protein